MKRKYLLLHILCMMFIISLALSVTVFSEYGEENALLPLVSGEWLYYDMGDSISVCGYTGNDEHITIPETIEGKTVNEISYNRYSEDGHWYGVVLHNSFFRYEGEIATKHITVPDTVKNIDNFAFYYCTSLEQADLPQGLMYIGRDAFANCDKLYKADIPDKVKEIGKSAFENTAISHVVLPDTLTGLLTGLGERAFFGCEALQSAKLPSNLTKIPLEFFGGCVSLGSAEIPDTVTFIGRDAFRNCTGLEEIKLPDGLTEISEGAFEGCISLKALEIPDTVKYIGESAFADCRSLESLKLPTNISTIAPRLFVNCRSLKVIEIPEGVKEIGWKTGVWAFEGCESLEEIHFPKSIRNIYNILHSNGSLKAVYFAADKDIAEALLGADIMSAMAAKDFVTDYSNVELHFGERESMEIPREKSPLDIIKDVLRITSVIFTLAFLIALVLNLTQKAALKPKKADRGENVMIKYNSPDMITCKHCGTASGREAKYCYNCGKKLTSKLPKGSGKEQSRK